MHRSICYQGRKGDGSFEFCLKADYSVSFVGQSLSVSTGPWAHPLNLGVTSWLPGLDPPLCPLDFPTGRHKIHPPQRGQDRHTHSRLFDPLFRPQTSDLSHLNCVSVKIVKWCNCTFEGFLFIPFSLSLSRLLTISLSAQSIFVIYSLKESLCSVQKKLVRGCSALDV